LISFAESGQVEKIEHIEDTLHLEKILITEVWKYNNGLPLSADKIENNKITAQKKYYYNSTGALDSIHKIENGLVFLKEIFINDRFGNDIQYYAISNKGDTTEQLRTKYIYDKHGNWTRRLQQKSNNQWPINLKPKFPDWDLTIREIKYAE
jgi:hypothetical protein